MAFIDIDSALTVATDGGHANSALVIHIAKHILDIDIPLLRVRISLQ